VIESGRRHHHEIRQIALWLQPRTPLRANDKRSRPGRRAADVVNPFAEELEMNRGRIKKLVTLMSVLAGATALTALTASRSSAQDCSAYEVDSGIQRSCNWDRGSYDERQFWTYYRASGCNPGTQTIYGPWYSTNKRCGFGGGGR
jgi:hypothetical protein